MNITSLNYTYAVDQKSYAPKSLTLLFTAKPKTAESAAMTMKIQSGFSKINQLKTVTIPASVKKDAVKVDPAQLINGAGLNDRGNMLPLFLVFELFRGY